MIKDTPFDISVLKSKRRYEINKGKKNFAVKRINPIEYKCDIYEVQADAFSAWPKKYRPIVNKEEFISSINNWSEAIVFGGFDKETGAMCAYAYLTEYPGHLEFNVLRAKPSSERRGINAAMVAGIVEEYNDKLGSDFYINDGSRSIMHETAFQDYLEKYFGFRKAYCKLHIAYRFLLGGIRMIYPLRNKIGTKTKLGSLIKGILKMEEFSR